MTATFRNGLVIGKFAPLHRGHELLLRSALARCERVYALSYANPSLAGCDATARARWMSELFPTIVHEAFDAGALPPALSMAWPDGLPADAASDDIQREFAATAVRTLFGVTIDAVFTSETYGDGFAAHLSAAQRRWAVEAPDVCHVSIDPARSREPVSARTLRADRRLHARFLAPAVRADFVVRVCLLGGESSGKSTLAERLAAALDTHWAREYGRDLWDLRGGDLRFDDMQLIAEQQVERERLAARAARHPRCSRSPNGATTCTCCACRISPLCKTARVATMRFASSRRSGTDTSWQSVSCRSWKSPAT